MPWKGFTPDQPTGSEDSFNFLQRLGIALSIMGQGLGGQPGQAAQTFMNFQILQKKLEEQARLRRQEQQKATIGQAAMGLVNPPPPDLQFFSQEQTGNMPSPTGGVAPITGGFPSPPMAAAGAPNLQTPYDMQRAIALAIANPDLREVLLGPATMQAMQQSGRLPSEAARHLGTLRELQGGLPPAGNQFEDISISPTGPTIARKMPTSFEQLQTGAISQTAKTPQETLTAVTEQKIDQKDLAAQVDNAVNRVHDMLRQIEGGRNQFGIEIPGLTGDKSDAYANAVALADYAQTREDMLAGLEGRKPRDLFPGLNVSEQVLEQIHQSLTKQLGRKPTRQEILMEVGRYLSTSGRPAKLTPGK